MDRLLPSVKLCKPSHDEAQDNEKGRTRCECRSQKTGGKECCKPERPGAKTGVNKGCYRVDADCQGYGKKDEWLQPGSRGHFLSLCLKSAPTYYEVEDEIEIQHDHIPEQDGTWGRVEYNIEDTGRLAEVNEDEQDRHGYRRYCKEFTKDGDSSKDPEVMKVIGENHHDRRGCHTHKESKIGNVEAPRDIPSHTCNPKAKVPLPHIEDKAKDDHGKE